MLGIRAFLPGWPVSMAGSHSLDTRLIKRGIAMRIERKASGYGVHWPVACIDMTPCILTPRADTVSRF